MYLRSRLMTALVFAALTLTPALILPDSGLAIPAATELDGKAISGKVLETMNTGGYTYLRIDAPQGKIWVAIPETKVEKGQEVTCKPGMTMTNFESKTLNRTFDTIVFSSGLDDGKASKDTIPNPHGAAPTAPAGDMSFEAAMQAEHGGSMGSAPAQAPMMGSGGSSSAIVPSKDISVEKVEGGYTVGECYDKRKELDNQKVKVRGKVVKVSKMIMGRNWVHIQDGTGNPMENTHDLVVTTQDDPAMDSVVVVEGTLHADRDFGAGYKYSVIIEDARIQ